MQNIGGVENDLKSLKCTEKIQPKTTCAVFNGNVMWSYACHGT